MADKRYDLTRDNNLGKDHPIEAGVEFKLGFTLKDDGVERPLGNHKATFTVLTDWGGTEILSVNSDDDPTMWTLSTGNVQLTVPRATTAGLTTRSKELEKEHGSARAPGVYVLTLEDKDADEVEVLLFGEEVAIEPTS